MSSRRIRDSYPSVERRIQAKPFFLPVITAGLIVIASRFAGWAWTVTLFLSVGSALLSETLGRATCLYLDMRRGLRRREWRALGGMAFDARRRIKSDFNRTSITWARGTDLEVSVGYATILLELLIEQDLGLKPTTQQVDMLVKQIGPAWSYVTGRSMTALRALFLMAADYRTGVFPEPTWDTQRSLAAAVGLVASRARRRRLRRVVLENYLALRD